MNWHKIKKSEPDGKLIWGLTAMTPQQLEKEQNQRESVGIRPDALNKQRRKSGYVISY